MDQAVGDTIVTMIAVWQEHSTMPTDTPDKANVIALPPIIVAVALEIGSLLQFVWPVRFLPYTEALWLGGLLIIASLPIVLDAARQLTRAKTTFDVRKPTREIVTRGVFGFTRNPTYLSMMSGFLGVAAIMDSLWLLLLAMPLVVVLQKGVIEPKERYLEQKFGENYLRYKARVRRWI